LIVPESQTAVSLVLVCGISESVLIQVTVVPTVTVSTLGMKTGKEMVTVAAAGGEADCADAFDATATPPLAVRPQAMQESPSASSRLPQTHRRGCVR
jgi:hypothetical protein